MRQSLVKFDLPTQTIRVYPARDGRGRFLPGTACPEACINGTVYLAHVAQHTGEIMWPSIPCSTHG